MFFNVVLIPMQLIVIYMGLKIFREPQRFHFEIKKIHESTEGLFDEKYIRKYNKRYMIPFLGILFAILLVMSLSTALFPREIYHEVIMGGFFLWFVVCIAFHLITRLGMSKKIAGS
ncbi:hypothetical protein [Isachenkonia alkalipeptolytica]|uniref:Uncharacterized protein n=1 Tax=Isachenkonia alkalipeptolytica TaxID=2565777 RepID=A0AA43XJX1_9CLOT|nr:hypothetical protein [Isachenkonia alkalipeptolytica]NBG88238.1 hypothetical protein [Isachenkonia alkalipeptolytica]